MFREKWQTERTRNQTRATPRRGASAVAQGEGVVEKDALEMYRHYQTEWGALGKPTG